MHRFARAALIAATGILFGVAPSVAKADSLSETETGRLLQGETISRTRDLQRWARRYVGGVAYKIVDATEEDLESLLGDVSAWRSFLPKTRSAVRVGSVGADPLVRITHGSSLVQVGYTLRVHREGNTVRFWMDHGRAHDIEDVWGFFRAEPLEGGRTLVSYGILVDMGDGILRDLFENRVRQVALEVPDYLRDALIERTARGERATR